MKKYFVLNLSLMVMIAVSIISSYYMADQIGSKKDRELHQSKLRSWT